MTAQTITYAQMAAPLSHVINIPIGDRSYWSNNGTELLINANREFTEKILSSHLQVL
jgi:hypothetical protein